MADFRQAMIWMKEGKNVTTSSLKDLFYVRKDCNMFQTIDVQEGKKRRGLLPGWLNFSSIEKDNEWELYKEKEPEYFIFVCPKCKKQLDVETLGKQCECGEWSYFETSKKKCVVYTTDETEAKE